MSTQQPDQNCPALRMLDHGNQYKLVLIVAPPGAGKNRLIRQWAQHGAKHCLASPLWIIVDDKTRNLPDFLNKLSSEITRWDQNIEAEAEFQSALLLERNEYSPNDAEVIQGLSHQIENLVNQLLNRLMQLPGDRFIIILNYHNFLDPRIHPVIGYLIEYFPPNMHMIISSQDHPPLPIPRFRARRELLEIDPDDLNTVFQ